MKLIVLLSKGLGISTMKIKLFATLCFILVATFSKNLEAQNRIPQNQYGTREANEQLLIEKQRLIKEMEESKNLAFKHSDTVLVESLSQLSDGLKGCPKESLDVIYTTADESFGYAVANASSTKWEALIQDCWVFVKLTKNNSDIPSDKSSNYFYFRTIEKLERFEVVDRSNAQYILRGSKEVYSRKESETTVSVSAFRVSDIVKYR
ncbi:hypothetical protein LMED105_09760 [Limnobacter sp. MED105]|nr:hypothetical protein LMED105_09760 [Limnobacter sp. MED105]